MGFDGLPWWQYFFCDGRIVVGLKDEGISLISYVGNQPVQCQNFFNGEISFYQDGKKIPFEKIDIFPFGFINNYSFDDNNYFYWMAIEGEKIVFYFSEGKREKIEVIIPKNSIVREIQRERILFEGLIYRENENDIYFHAKDHLEVERKPGGLVRAIHVPELPPLELKGETFGIITSEIKFDFKENKKNYSLIFQGNKNFTLSFLFGKSMDELKNLKEEYLNDPTGCFNRQMKRYQKKSENLPKFYSSGSLNMGNYRNISRFFRMQPLYIESMKIDNTGTFRACNAYYWAWGWDITLPCFGLLYAGEYSSVKDALIFLNKTSRKDGSIAHAFTSDFQHYHTCSIGAPQNTSFIVLVDRYFSLTNDFNTLKKLSSQIEKIFMGIYRICDETGFYLTLGAGTDDPEEFGRTSFAYVSLEMGWWYEASICLQRIFQLLDKPDLSKKAKEISEKIESNFLKLFYNEELGYLHEAVHPENCPFGLAGEVNDTPLITNIGLMLSLYGENLIWEKEEEISTFCEREFLREDGIHYKPIWEKRGYYGWTRIGENWFTRDDMFLARLLRKSGKGKALEKMMNLYEETFAFYNCVFEGKTLSVRNPKPLACPGKWQAFGSASWYRSVIEGFLGIEIDEGGLTYIPADLNLEMNLTNLRFRNTFWDIKISGSGSYVKSFIVDGKRVQDTLKIPFSFYKEGKHRLEIVRSIVPFQNPTLLEATGAKLKEVKNKNGKFYIECENRGPFVIKFYSPEKISIFVNGVSIPYKWNEKRKIGFTLLK